MEMSPGRRRWSLGSLLLLLGGNLALRVRIHQDLVHGTEGQSVLLPVSYTLDGASRFPLPIRWRFRGSPDEIIACTVFNCSLDAGGAPYNCSAGCFPSSMIRGRAEFFPDNGSLLLRDLELSDSGVYSVAFKGISQTWPITLVVHQQPSTSGPTSPTKNPPTRYEIIGGSSSVALVLLLLLFCCLWHRAQQKKRRIIKQQQVSGVEEPCMESTMVRDMMTIYTRIGDSLEQPQPRPASEVVYTSISHPEPPGLDTALYHVIV